MYVISWLPSTPHSQQGILLPRSAEVSFSASYQHPLKSHITQPPWKSRCEKYLTLWTSHSCWFTVTWSPTLRAKNFSVSVQVTWRTWWCQNSFQNHRWCKAIFEYRYFHLTPFIWVPWTCWGRYHGRHYALQPVFSCTSYLLGHSTDMREYKEFSKFKLGCKHSFPVCANCQQLKHMHCSHLPWGIPLKLGEGRVSWLQGHPVAFNAELDGPMHFAESFLFSKPSLVFFQATNTSLNSPGLETISQLMHRRRDNSRKHSNYYFFHLHVFYHVLLCF